MKRMAAIIVGLALALNVLALQPALASSVPAPAKIMAVCGQGGIFGFPTWYSCLPGAPDNPRIDSLDDVLKIAFPLVETLIKASAYIAAGFIIWGAIRFVKSQGDPSKVAEAKNTIADAIIGMLICIISVGVVNFVAGAIK